MTKEELIGLVQLNLGNAGNLHEQQVHLNISLAWQQVLFALYSKNPGYIDRYVVHYKSQPVLRDEDTGQYYCTLPTKPIRFTDTAEGLRRITKSRQKSDSTYTPGDELLFIPIPAQQPQLLVNTDASQVNDCIGYYITGGKIWFWKMNTDITAVNLEIVPVFEEIGYEDEIDIPAGGVQMLIGITQEILKGTPYVDPRLRKINLHEI